jgi:hypothetical protein
MGTPFNDQWRLPRWSDAGDQVLRTAVRVPNPPDRSATPLRAKIWRRVPARATRTASSTTPAIEDRVRWNRRNLSGKSDTRIGTAHLGAIFRKG